MKLLTETLNSIEPASAEFREQATRRIESLTMPHWALGRLLDLAVDLARDLIYLLLELSGVLHEVLEALRLNCEAHVHDLGVAGVYVPADGGTDFCHGHWPHDNLVLQ